MIQGRAGANIAARTAQLGLLLVVTILILLQSILAAQNPRTTSESVSPVSKWLKTYHDGSIRDISAVGNRDIGCTRGLGGQYSLEAQSKLGQSYAQQVEKTFKIVTDPVLTEYVNRIGQNLVGNSDTQVPLTVKIIDSNEVNALSLPGGFIFVDSGVILVADSEAELAAVISHEIAHVAACHAAQEMAREEQSKLASMPLIFKLALRRITLNTSYLKPTRIFESEADLLGAEYLYKAGYDPQALASFLEKVKATERPESGSRAKNFESQPRMTARIERTQQDINTLLPPAAEYKVDTSEFQEIKKRLALVKNSQ